MSATVLELPGSTLEAISEDGDTVTLRLSPAFLLKSEGIPGADPGTRHRFAAQIILRGAELQRDIPALPAVIEEGRIRVNIHTYVNLVPRPLLEHAGHARVELLLAERVPRVIVEGASLSLVPLEAEHYIGHMD